MLDCIISLDDNKLYYTHCISLNKLSKKTNSFLHFYASGTIKGENGNGVRCVKSKTFILFEHLNCSVSMVKTMRRNAITII